VESAPTTTSCWFRAGRIFALSLTLALVIVRSAAAQMPPVAGAPAVLPGIPLELPIGPKTIAWTVDIPAAPIVSPIITSDRVIAAYLPGIVAGFDRMDGRQLWQKDLEPTQPLAADGPLVFVHAGEAIYALQAADGSEAWRTPSGTLTAPLVVKQGWVVAATEGKLTALRASDGSTVWTRDAPRQREAAAIAGDILYVPVVGGKVIARDLPDGNVRWERQLGGNAVEPFVVNDDIFLGASDKVFYCVNAASGEIAWPRRVGAMIRGRAATDGDRIFFTALDNQVHAIDRGDGAIRWERGIPFRPISGPVVGGGAVFVAGNGPDLWILRAKDGTPAGTITFPGKQQPLPPGSFDTGAGVEFATVTGSLEESWKLSLTVPLPASLRASR
jgi:outer membrane protein assembly factor BamB